MTLRFILAALSGAIVQFLLGWLIYGILLADFMAANTLTFEGLMKDMGGSFMILTFLAGLTMSVLVTFIFHKWAKFDKFLDGLWGGMILGFFIALSVDLSFIAMMNLITWPSLIVDVLANTIVVGVVGGVIACVLGYRLKAA